MQARAVKIVSSSLVIVVAGAILFFRFFEPTTKVEPRPHLAIGQALAEQAAKLLGSGGRITLVAPDTAAYRHPGAELQLKAFHRALRDAKLSVSATNLIKLDPLFVPRVPPGYFVTILRKQSEGDVVVSLFGPPVLTPEQRAQLGEKRPRVVAVCSGDMPRQIDLKAIFADNLLHAAIISRARTVGAGPSTDSLPDWFNYSFQWITPQNLADLPSVETGGR